MQQDEKEILAQELARAFIQFKRVGWHQNAGQEVRRSEFILLATISRNIDPESRGMKVSDLSARMQITPAGVTHMINSLEDGNYVERLTDPSDRRNVLVKPTSKGKQLIELMNARLVEHLTGLIDFLGEKDSKELVRILTSTFTYFKEK